MEISYSVQVWREGSHFIAHAMPLDVASSGASPAHARAALEEAVRLFLETARRQGTLAEVLTDAGYEFGGEAWQSPEWVGVERHTAPLAA